MRFTVIKNVNEYKDTISDLFKSLVGSKLRVDSVGDDLVLYFSYDNINEIEDTLNALESELLVSVCSYISYDSDSELRLKMELDIAEELLDIIPHGVYDLKSALLLNPRLKNPTYVLEFILDHTNVSEEFIKGFTDNNLNISQASKNMYIHRNTIMYKLDKLLEASGFDLRVFKDAYILYSLIKNK